MDDAGLLFVRTRTVTALFVSAATYEPFNLVGVYWKIESGEHAFVLFDLVSGDTVRLEVDADPSGEIVVIDASLDTVEKTLTGHPMIAKMAVWPFLQTDADRVYEFACEWLKMSRQSFTLFSFLNEPFGAMKRVPPHPNLFLAPVDFPGTYLFDYNPVPTELSNEDRDTITTVFQKLDSREIVMTGISCIWCTRYREMVDTLVDPHIGWLNLERTRHLLGHRLGSENVHTYLVPAPAPFRTAWSALLGHIEQCMTTNQEAIHIPLSLLVDTAATLHVDVPEAVLGIREGTFSAFVSSDGPEAKPTRGILSGGARFLPWNHADLTGMTRAQLIEVERHLAHPSLAADPRTSDLRLRIHEALS